MRFPVLAGLILLFSSNNIVESICIVYVTHLIANKISEYNTFYFFSSNNNEISIFTAFVTHLIAEKNTGIKS